MAERNEIRKEPLTTREKMTIYLLVFLIKVIKPFDWVNEVDESMEEIIKLMKAENE